MQRPCESHRFWLLWLFWNRGMAFLNICESKVESRNVKIRNESSKFYVTWIMLKIEIYRLNWHSSKICVLNLIRKNKNGWKGFDRRLKGPERDQRQAFWESGVFSPGKGSSGEDECTEINSWMREYERKKVLGSYTMPNQSPCSGLQTCFPSHPDGRFSLPQ